MDSQSITPPWLDKALWIAVLMPVCLFANAKFGLHLDASEIAGFILPVTIYIVGHKWKSGAIAVAEVKAQADSQRVTKVLPDGTKVVLPISSLSLQERTSLGIAPLA